MAVLVRCRICGAVFALGVRLDRCPSCGQLNVERLAAAVKRGVRDA